MQKKKKKKVEIVLSPFDDEGAGGLAVLVQEGAPVGSIEGAGSASRRDESVCLHAVVHAVARSDPLLGVARVQDAVRSEL